jgi:Di-haem oxidoreductase, putative peroxidase
MLRASLSFAGSLLLSATCAAQAGNVAIQPAMGDPLPGLTPALADRFAKGKLAFEHVLTVPEGLGPCFNDPGCAQCHALPRAGGGSAITETRFGTFTSGVFDPLTSLGGSLLQAKAIDPQCLETVPPQATVTALRATTSIFGAGLVESISDATLLALQDHPPDPAVSGLANMVTPLEAVLTLRVGRFGWKSQIATLMSFSGEAAQQELGLTNVLAALDEAPNGNQALLSQCDTVPDPEAKSDADGFLITQRMRDFQQLLAAPPQTPRSGMSGEALFAQVGCAACHVANLVTGPGAFAVLSNKPIHPYSDYLLHSMGTLGDNITQGLATGLELRTSPLWGLSARAPIGLLHDLSASGGTAQENIEASIAAHDGEGHASTIAFFALGPSQRAQLLAFLMSLGQLEFDADRDADVDALDWFLIDANGWFQGPAARPVTPDDPAALADVDQDGDVDLVDFGLLQRAMSP